MPEDCTTEERSSAVCFRWANGFNAKDIHKEIIPVYSECFPCKVVLNWVEKCGKHFTDNEEVQIEVCKWLRQQSKDFYTAGFNALGQVYHCW
jgi:hypothetical protein